MKFCVFHKTPNFYRPSKKKKTVKTPDPPKKYGQDGGNMDFFYDFCSDWTFRRWTLEASEKKTSCLVRMEKNTPPKAHLSCWGEFLLNVQTVFDLVVRKLDSRIVDGLEE